MTKSELPNDESMTKPEIRMERVGGAARHAENTCGIPGFRSETRAPAGPLVLTGRVTRSSMPGIPR